MTSEGLTAWLAAVDLCTSTSALNDLHINFYAITNWDPRAQRLFNTHYHRKYESLSPPTFSNCAVGGGWEEP